MAQSAHDGLARAVFPAHTRADGDAFVAAAVGGVGAEVDVVRSLAVHVVARAIAGVAAAAPGSAGAGCGSVVSCAVLAPDRLAP